MDDLADTKEPLSQLRALVPFYNKKAESLNRYIVPLHRAVWLITVTIRRAIGQRPRPSPQKFVSESDKPKPFVLKGVAHSRSPIHPEYSCEYQFRAPPLSR